MTATGRATRRGLLVALALSASAGTPLRAAEIRPAVVYDLGTKFDKSFNEGVFGGAERFRKEAGGAVAEFEPTNETQFEQAHRRFAGRGQDPILAVGFNQASVLDKVAMDFPKTRFSLIDGVSKLPNVQSVLFREQEGSFLVGMLAAMASKTGKIGFVGGMDIPLIRRFACGYAQGMKYANPAAELIQNMTGTTPSAWNDPGRGAELGARAVRSRRGRRSSRRAGRDRHRRAPGPPRIRASSRSGSIPTRTTYIPARC